MSSVCEGASCEVEKASGSCQTKCPCGTEGCCGDDPIECAVGMWSCAFFQAMKETQVEVLKGKIQKAWGAKMDKAADAVLEAMGAQWQSMLAKAQSKGALKDTLESLWKQSQK